MNFIDMRSLYFLLNHHRRHQQPFAVYVSNIYICQCHVRVTVQFVCINNLIQLQRIVDYSRYFFRITLLVYLNNKRKHTHFKSF